MGWKGALRSVNAELKRQGRAADKARRQREREAMRRSKELAKQAADQQKRDELLRARIEVERFELTLQVLNSVHQDCSDPIDWLTVAGTRGPSAPERSTERESAARSALEEYEPGFFDKLFGKAKMTQEALEADIELAIQADEAEHKEAMQNHQTSLEDHAALLDLARRVLKKQPKAYLEVLEEMGPFTELSELGGQIRFGIDPDRPELLNAEVEVRQADVVPTEIKVLTKRGKVSTKPMPKGRGHEIYQDYVCGAALRIAREGFALLPIEQAVVTITTPWVNPKTGHESPAPILRVHMDRKTTESLRFDQLDPSAAMANFQHAMKFLKTKGMQPL